MRNALLGLIALGLLALGIASAPADPVYQSQTYACTKATQFSGTAGTVRIAQGTTTGQIYICGWSLLPTASATFQFEYGTGSNCGTGTTTLTPQFSLTAGQQFVDHTSFYSGFTPIPSGDDLCIVVGGTGPVPGVVYYTQF